MTFGDTVEAIGELLENESIDVPEGVIRSIDTYPEDQFGYFNGKRVTDRVGIRVKPLRNSFNHCIVTVTVEDKEKQRYLVEKDPETITEDLLNIEKVAIR